MLFAPPPGVKSEVKKIEPEMPSPQNIKRFDLSQSQPFNKGLISY